MGTESPGLSYKSEISLGTGRNLDRDQPPTTREEMAALVSSLAHEITEPIAAVELCAGACLRWIDRDTPALEEVRKALLRIIKDTQRAASIVERNRALFSEEQSA